MIRLRVFLSRVAGLFQGSRGDADLLEDIETHLAFLADEYRRRGLPDHEARLAARKAFGGVDQTREAAGDVRSFVWVEEARQDLGYAVRLLRRTPIFSAAAVATLALGIGSATVMSSVVRGLLLRPLPYRGADRLLMVQMQDPKSGRGRSLLSWDEVQDFQAQSSAFDGVVGTIFEPVTLASPSGVELVRGVRVTPDFFQVMGMDPQIGRMVGLQDMSPESPRVAVLRYRTWISHFAGDPQAIGQTILINGEPLTIVGVMPPRFTFQGADVWVSGLATAAPDRVFCYARLKPGVTAAEAEAQLNVIAARRPSSHRSEHHEKFRAIAQPLLPLLVGRFRATVYTAVGAVALLLLIACCNVANMLLARMIAREREMSIRAALGAGRWRVARQVFAEGLVLAILGAIGGSLLAYWGIKGLVLLLPDGALPSEVQFGIDGAVLATAVVLGGLSAVIFGAAPCLYSTRRNLVDGLRGDSRTTASTGGALRHGLLVAQVALSLVLLISAGLLMRNFASLVRTDVGVDASRLLVMTVLATGGQPDTAADEQRFYDELLPRIASLPGVESAASTGSLPPGSDHDDGVPISVVGQPLSAESTSQVQFCTGGYFRTVGMRLLRGRVFSLTEHRRGSQAIVNHAFSRRYFDSVDPVGQHIEVDLSAMAPGADARRMVEIVGVVEDAKNAGLRAPTAPQIYLPGVGSILVVRTSGDPTRLRHAVDTEVTAAGRHVDLRSLATLEKVLELSDYANPRFSMTALAIFALTGTALVSMGIFGVFAYTVSRARREIAIRMALGASESMVVIEVLGGGFRVILLGVALGVPVSVAVGRLLESQLWGVSPHDPVTLLASVGLVGVVALAASYIPARRAASVDPLATLRQE